MILSSLNAMRRVIFGTLTFEEKSSNPVPLQWSKGDINNILFLNKDYKDIIKYKTCIVFTSSHVTEVTILDGSMSDSFSYFLS